MRRGEILCKNNGVFGGIVRRVVVSFGEVEGVRHPTVLVGIILPVGANDVRLRRSRTNRPSVRFAGTMGGEGILRCGSSRAPTPTGCGEISQHLVGEGLAPPAQTARGDVIWWKSHERTVEDVCFNRGRENCTHQPFLGAFLRRNLQKFLLFSANCVILSYISENADLCPWAGSIIPPTAAAWEGWINSEKKILYRRRMALRQ